MFTAHLPRIGTVLKTKRKEDCPAPPTLKDVARAADLSPITVSRALNSPQLLRPDTIAKVQAAIKATGYIPNRLAGSLASNKSKLIAVIVPQLNNSMFSDTIQAISDELARRHYHMLLCVSGYTEETETEILQTILSRRPDGIVLTGIHHANELKRTILNAHIPVVEIWDLTPTPIDMLVGFSHQEIGRTLGRYVLEQGFHRPGLIWTPDYRAEQRKHGLLEQLGTAAKTVTEARVELPATLRQGREAMARLLDNADMPDLVICSSDTLAQGAMIEAQSRAIGIPEQISVIGFGDLDFAAYLEPALTTVGVDKIGIGRSAATLLVDKIEKKDIAEPIINVGFTLHQRQSSR